MKRFWQLLLVGYVAFALPATVLAQSLGLNFAATDPDAATSTLNPNEFAGVASQANWNNLTLNTGSSGPLVIDTDGVSSPSTATVSWNSPNTWRSTTGNNQFPAGPNRKLTAGYLDSTDQAAGVSMVSVGSIDASLRSTPYDVYVYFVSDSGANRGGAYTLTPSVGTPVVKYGSTLANPTMHVEDPGTDMDLTLDGTYLRFTGLTAPGFTLTGDASLTTPNGFRAPINAVQIVKPTVPGDVNRDGQVNLTDFHIIRGNLFKTGQSRAQGDLVGGNGIVDFADYREWKNNVPAGLAAGVSLTPEPSAAIMLSICGSLVALFTRRGPRKPCHVSL